VAVASGRTVETVDPFDLPEWVGEGPVRWHASSSLGGSHRVTGELVGGAEGRTLVCDVLACDLAYPVPVLSESWRHDAHQAWVLGEVLLLRYDGTLTLVVPGTVVTAEPILEAIRRLARAVGSLPERFTVALRL
jgi:hypothetical protein